MSAICRPRTARCARTKISPCPGRSTTASAKRLADIAKAVKDADGLILATDPDREGEAISWHVLEVLKQKRALKDKPVSRVVFNAITKQSVLDAMATSARRSTRRWSTPIWPAARSTISSASRSRRCCGASCPAPARPAACSRWRCAWSATAKPRSSASCREEYWTDRRRLLGTPRNETFEARLTAFDGKKLDKLDIKNEAQADDIKAMLEGADASRSLSVEAKPTKRNPARPSPPRRLQQDASSRLGFSAKRTMQVAQRLYEGMDIGGETAGLITYMRTDGVQMAPEAIAAARDAIGKEFGDRYLPEKPRHYTTKAKNAQEAHEAIRPTDFFRTPASVRRYLDADQARLYELIWKRAIASQMQPAEIERTTVEIEAVNGAGSADLRAVGSVVRFDGFLAAYTDQKDEDAEDEENRRLPEIRAGETLAARGRSTPTQHFTEPPPRYSEASLIKKMEELGIGRPSTYASTLKTLRDRDYVTHRQAPADARRQGPAGDGVPRKLLRALCRV